MHHNRIGLGMATVAVALMAAATVPSVAGALPKGGGGGVPLPPTTRPPVTAPPTTAPPTTVTAPIITPVTGVFTLPRPPDAPGLYPLQASRYNVVVPWYDRSDNEQSFIVYRRDGQGNWQNVYQVASYNQTGSGENYSWVDSDTNQSGQCYMIAAVGSTGTTDSSEECTVRPDANQFPQTEPSGTVQWYGLSGYNDGTGPLQTAVRQSYTNLTWSNETFGVDLDWSENTSLWKVQAPGGANVMYGEAVALRVWGGGWLTYGHETWGVDLQLSSTPAYQWYILGETPGNTVDSGEFALWNSAANDFLVFGNQTWGVDLNWYKKTLPQTTQPPPPPPGVKLFAVYNCIMEDRPLEMWVADRTTGSGWVDMGEVEPGWIDGDGCEEQASDLWTFTPVSGHKYEVESVDFDADGCSNDPNVADCWRSDTTFTGDANGQVVADEIG